jgi:hypothetical protein
MGGEETLDRICSQLSDVLTELRTVREKLQEFDGTVAAVSLRRELSRVQRHLDTVSEMIAKGCGRPSRIVIAGSLRRAGVAPAHPRTCTDGGSVGR